jgi:hypothetical protein
MRTFFMSLLVSFLALVAILTIGRVVEYIRCTNRCASIYTECVKEAQRELERDKRYVEAMKKHGLYLGEPVLKTGLCNNDYRLCNSNCEHNALRSPF